MEAQSPPRRTLDELVIRASSHTPFFGVYLATHAIPDALCMCHASVGCKVKTQQHLVDHDGIADAHNRMRYSQFIDEDLISGSTQQLEDEIRAFATRRGSKVVVIDSSTPISLQAQPLGPLSRRLEAALGCDVVHVDSRNYDADLWQGYDACMATLLARQSWPALDDTVADEVAVVGYPFDRYEADHSATVAELRRLLFGLGLQARAVWLAGEPYATLQQITRARHIVLLPWADKATERALRDTGRVPVRAGLPMGLDGTAAWLRRVAAGCGVDPGRAERVVAHERARVKASFELAHRRLAGRGFAVCAEAPRAAGLAAVLLEVGMRAELVSVAHFGLGGQERVEAMWRDDLGQRDVPVAFWLEDPTPATLRRLAAARAGWLRPGRGGPGLRGEGGAAGASAGDAAPGAMPALARVDVVLGTTLDRDELEAAGLPFVEIGYPSERHHCLFPAPWMGTNGALHLLDRVLAALEMRDERGR